MKNKITDEMGNAGKRGAIAGANLARALSSLSLAGLNCAEIIKNLSKSLELAYFKYWTTENQWKIFGWQLDRKLNEVWFLK